MNVLIMINFLQNKLNMKKLKITIAGEVKTFDLPENGEYKCEVTEFYIPKAGDCVMIESKETDTLYWCKVTNVTSIAADFKICVNSRLEISKKGFFNINKNRIYTKITPEELKAKYGETGYDWDYETDTIKPIKWMPKEGDKVWRLNSSLVPIAFVYCEGVMFLKKWLDAGLLLPTEEECQKFADHCMSYINNKKE